MDKLQFLVLITLYRLINLLPSNGQHTATQSELWNVSLNLEYKFDSIIFI